MKNSLDTKFEEGILENKKKATLNQSGL